METLLSTQITPNFSKIAVGLQKGKRFGILYGKTKKPVAMLVPFEEKAKERKIGILDGKAKIEFASDFKMTTEELLELK
jgi:hypothetical protein